MAGVTLVDSRFSLLSDLTQTIEMELTGERDTSIRPVQVRRYANGRVRAITRTGVKKQLSLNFELADRSDYDTLIDWIGQVVLWRDPRGRKVYGVYDVIEGRELPGVDDDVLNVDLTFLEVTVSEAV